jgi:hypothetical protein
MTSYNSTKDAYKIFKDSIESGNFIADLEECLETNILENPIILIISIQEDEETSLETEKKNKLLEIMIPSFNISGDFSKIHITIFYDKIDKIRSITCSVNNVQCIYFDKGSKIIYLIFRVNEKSEEFLSLLDKLYTTPKPAKR